MALVIAPVLDDVFTLVRAFVLTVLSPVGSTAVPVIQLPTNRTALPPPTPGFVGMRLRTLTLHRTPEESWDTAIPDPNSISIEQGTLIALQLDCYGANSGNWAAMLAALMRTDYACRQLAPVAPLYANDPTQAPLVNDEEQYELRWIVNINLQYNPVVSTPMQFADTGEVTLINVDEEYPP